jgi:two-component system, response regulator YesN
MYRVIVVDDEIWICKLIRKIIDWDEVGFQITAEADSGTAALQLIESHKPDLVITDIRMPGMDGISLIKNAREKNIDSEFIIISGFSDFEYARSAIAYDVFGYLLKPLDKDELLDILVKAKDKIDKNHAIKSKIEISDSKILQQLMLRIIAGEEKRVEIDPLNAQYGTHFADGKYRAAILKLDAAGNLESALSGCVGAIESVKSAYAPFFHEIIFFADQPKSQIVLILNANAQSGKKAEEMLHEILTNCEKNKNTQDAFQITAGIGTMADSLKEIGKSYLQALQAVRARTVLGSGKVFDYEKLRIPEAKEIIDIRDRKKLATSFDLFDVSGAAADIAKIFRKAAKANPGNPVIYHLAALEMMDLLYASTERKALNNGQMKAEEMCRIDDCLTIQQIEACVMDTFQGFCRLFEEERQKSGNKTIHEIKAFISENYMLNISLDDVAKLVCLNPTYVSEIFKKKTGENFSEYLINYRIHIAKDLLRDVKYKIADVSTMVGYQDPKYFSRLFKQKVGVNPSDYRNLYQ